MSKKCLIARTLRDIAEESQLLPAERKSLKAIAKIVDKMFEELVTLNSKKTKLWS